MTQPGVTSHAAPSPARPVFDWLFHLAVAGIVATFVRVFWFTPYEASQGAAQKIFYIHVSAAMSAYLALIVAAVMSLVYLWLKDDRADRLAESAGEVALVFTSAVLLTGPLWGRPVWGTWWSWGDPRLTSTLFLWFLTAAYLVLRGAVDDRGMRARYSAVLAVLAALLIPFIHLSVYFFRALHPMPIVLKPDRPSLPGEMLTTFIMANVVFPLFAVALIRARSRLGLLREQLEDME
jgi:heme exporter protein C